jgi:biofilm PGA synthesis N-glycosyltransferase PgaC
LPSILEQDYPILRLLSLTIFRPTKHTWILQEFDEQYAHLKIVDDQRAYPIEAWQKIRCKYWGSRLQNIRRHWLTLTFTDADCAPQSNQWLKEVASAFRPETEIVLGYSPYFKKEAYSIC